MQGRNRKKIVLGLMVLAGAILVLGVSGPVFAVDKIMVGSTGTASSHYVYSVSAGKAINSISGAKVQANVVATGGAVDNLERIHRGHLQMGLGTWATVYQAYKGIGKYKGKPRTKIRALWVYTVCGQNYIARVDSGIKDLSNLTGKKFCPGMRGSATEQMVMQILKTIGVKPDYYRASLADAVAAIKDNRISGFAKSGAGLALDAASKELMAFTKIVVLNWSPQRVAKVQKTMPFVSFLNIPKDTTPGVGAYTTPAQIVGFAAYDDSLTEDQAYYITKGIVEGQKYQEAAYPAIKGFNIPKNTIELTKFPLHVGAIRYYKEIGYKVPTRLIPPEAK